VGATRRWYASRQWIHHQLEIETFLPDAQIEIKKSPSDRQEWDLQ